MEGDQVSQSTPVRSPINPEKTIKSDGMKEFRRELEVIKVFVVEEKREMFNMKDSLKTIGDKLNDTLSGLNNTTV